MLQWQASLGYVFVNEHRILRKYIVGWGKKTRGAILNKWGNSVLGIISQNILKIINFFFHMWVKSCFFYDVFFSY